MIGYTHASYMIPVKIKYLKVLVILSFSTIALGVFLNSKYKWFPKNDLSTNNSTMVDSLHSKVSLRDSIVAFGLTFLGTPYTDSGCGIDGFDCSGFVFFVFKNFHIQVPHSSSQFKDFGKEVPIEQVKKGDVLVFLSPTKDIIGHVGIVTNARGLNSDFIHSTSGHEMKVTITNLANDHYKKRFVKAVNVLGDL